LNAATHNCKSANFSLIKGPLLKKGEKLKIEKCWRRRSQGVPPDCFKAQGMEMAEGTNALVTPNSQDPVLNSMVPCDENIKMAFRPNTSIRDYLRFMYPQATVTQTPTTIKNVVAFDVFNLVKANSNADMFQALYSLYLGVSGGFKFKFKISGVANASATFVPPSSYCMNSSYLRLYPMSNAVPTDANSLTNFLSGMTYNPTTKSFTAPQIEMQDYTRPYNNAGTSVTSRPGSSMVLEMAIPNMNPFNFAGNASKWYSNTYDIENDLGVIYISYDASFDGTTYSTVNIIPFIGLNDEARLGFQVYAPQKQIPTYTASTPASVCRSSILHPTNVGTTYPNGIPINPLPLVGSSYYFNTT